MGRLKKMKLINYKFYLFILICMISIILFERINSLKFGNGKNEKLSSNKIFDKFNDKEKSTPKYDKKSKANLFANKNYTYEDNISYIVLLNHTYLNKTFGKDISKDSSFDSKFNH